jgi:L-serine dehydratase
MKQLNALDLFTVGIGPSSSHTVGPMRAARLFALELQSAGLLAATAKIQITLYGSLGATGAGHGTTNALIAGLAGETAETCDPAAVLAAWSGALAAGQISVLGHTVQLVEADLKFEPRTHLPRHSNGMLFEAFDTAGAAAALSPGESGAPILSRQYFSVGGGFVEGDEAPLSIDSDVPYAFASAAELIEICEQTGLTIAQVVRANAVAQIGEAAVEAKLASVWAAMSNCVESGLKGRGVLPGYLAVPRRAAAMAAGLRAREAEFVPHSELANEWLQAYAIAVNEENAAGMRVVTAPTNGAAGIIPAVGYFAKQFKKVSDQQLAHDFLLTAAGIGSLYKMNASISGAEAGCQGEVGSACSMAAGGLAAVLGGTVRQIENAAEIAMEHNLGLTCDPVGGFVQLPCIERNAIAAGTAVAAVRLALMGDGSHKISLDTVIETMRQTGLDMSTKYKETSMGGLAVNVIEC